MVARFAREPAVWYDGSMSKPPDYYAILGVAPTASAKDLKSAYRTLAKRMHPDAGGDAAKFAQLNEAADVLTDPDRRAGYYRERAGGGAAKPGAASGGRASTPPPAPEAPPPKKATVALCEFCNAVNRVAGDPRYYPAKCGKCGRQLGSKLAEPSSGTDPFEDFARSAAGSTEMARCPHCQMRNYTNGPGAAITCMSCGRSYTPGEAAAASAGSTNESEAGGFGRVMSDMANQLFGANADTTTRGMRFAEDRLREMADELRRRREDLERRR